MTNNKGFGVFSNSYIKKGTLLMRYSGVIEYLHEIEKRPEEEDLRKRAILLQKMRLQFLEI